MEDSWEVLKACPSLLQSKTLASPAAPQCELDPGLFWLNARLLDEKLLVDVGKMFHHRLNQMNEQFLLAAKAIFEPGLGISQAALKFIGLDGCQDAKEKK